MEEQKEHKRRVRYKGTHPRNYNEKYKELNPEKYQGTIEHVIFSEIGRASCRERV